MNLEFNRNEDVLKQSLSEMRRRLEKIYEGGGKKPLTNKEKKINSLPVSGLIKFSTLSLATS